MNISPQAGSLRPTLLEELYAAVRRSPPGSIEEMIAEKAIDYALNASPPADLPDHHAIFGYRRNARHNVYRSLQREREGLTRLQLVAGSTGGKQAVEPDPENHAVAGDLLTRLHRAVHRTDPSLTHVLGSMLAETPAAAAADATGQSVRSVERMRARIRRIAGEVLIA